MILEIPDPDSESRGKGKEGDGSWTPSIEALLQESRGVSRILTRSPQN